MTGMGLGGHQFIDLGKLPNHWTDRDQMWHTYTDSSGNGHRLNKINPSSAKGAFGGGQGVTNSKMWERSQTAGPLGNNFGTRMHIHLGMDMSSNQPLDTRAAWGLGGHKFINMGKLPAPGPIGTKLGTRIQIHQGMERG